MTDIEVQGSPKELLKVADSGNAVKNYFCPDCGAYLADDTGDLDL